MRRNGGVIGKQMPAAKLPYQHIRDHLREDAHNKSRIYFPGSMGLQHQSRCGDNAGQKHYHGQRNGNVHIHAPHKREQETDDAPPTHGVHADFQKVIGNKRDDHRNENAQEKSIEKIRADAFANKGVKGPEIKYDSGNVGNDPVFPAAELYALHETEKSQQNYYEQREQEADGRYAEKKRIVRKAETVGPEGDKILRQRRDGDERDEQGNEQRMQKV